MEKYALVFILFFSQASLRAQVTSYDSIWPESYLPQKSNFFVHNEIEINAPAEKVWAILIDALKWSEWYVGASELSFINIKDSLLGANVSFKWKTMGLNFKSTIQDFIPNKLLAWESKKSSIQGYHIWLIVPTSNGCKVITDEAQNGLLSTMEKIFQPNKLKRLHDIWLSELKNKAEGKSFSLNQNERDQLIKILNASYQRFLSSINGLSPQQLNFRPAKNKWSIAECIEHICNAEKEFPAILTNSLKLAPNPALRKNIKIKDDAIYSRMTSRRWRARSPEKFKPIKNGGAIESTLKEFYSQRENTIQYVKITQDDLRNHYWKHPLTGRIDLYQTLILMSAHLDRHLDQIEIIKSYKNFPKN